MPGVRAVSSSFPSFLLTITQSYSLLDAEGLILEIRRCPSWIWTDTCTPVAWRAASIASPLLAGRRTGAAAVAASAIGTDVGAVRPFVVEVVCCSSEEDMCMEKGARAAGEEARSV